MFREYFIPRNIIPRKKYSGNKYSWTGIYIPISNRNIYSWNNSFLDRNILIPEHIFLQEYIFLALSGIFVPGIFIPETHRNIYSWNASFFFYRNNIPGSGISGIFFQEYFFLGTFLPESIRAKLPPIDIYSVDTRISLMHKDRH